VKLPELPTASQRPVTFVTNNSVFETNSFGWRHWDTPGVDASAWEQYDHDMKDPALWLVREEERIGFETKYIFHDGQRFVLHFGILFCLQPACRRAHEL
jgi:hypothetical protein